MGNISTLKAGDDVEAILTRYTFFKTTKIYVRKNMRITKKVLKFVLRLSFWRWILGGGVGVHCTVNPLYDGLTSADEAPKAVWIFISETLTIRPLGLAVNGWLP